MIKPLIRTSSDGLGYVCASSRKVKTCYFGVTARTAYLRWLRHLRTPTRKSFEERKAMLLKLQGYW